MNAAATVFESHRPRLFGIAYRMLGIRSDAEDLVQDAYLRWHQAPTHEIESPLAFLVTVTKRLCLDRLRELKKHRATYVDELPEAIVEDQAPSPEALLEFSQEVSAGFVAVLADLSPAETAAFLLHDVFDFAYPEVAQILGKSEPCCRQTLHRARASLRERQEGSSAKPRGRVQQGLLGKLLAAAGAGDRHGVVSLLAEMGAHNHCVG